MQSVVIFDFDGTLADTLEDMLSIAEQVTAGLGVPARPSQADLEVLESMSFVEYGKQLGVPEDQIDNFCAQCFNRFAALPEPASLFPGMREVVQNLARSCTMAIVTGNHSAVVQRFLDYHGLSAWISPILGADRDGSRLEKLELLRTMFGESRKKFYLVGDAVSDVLAAKQADMISVAITWGHQSEDRLRKSEPSYIAHTPAELLQLITCDGH